jgi:hypothetical protein
VRVDSVVDADWGNGPPAKDFKTVEYSVRWTGTLIAPATIKGVSIDVTTDDGVRLFIDGKKVVDDWRDRSAETDSYVMDLEAGRAYDIQIEYYQDGGGASARLSWSAEKAIHTEYFSNQIALSCRTPEMAGCMSFASQVADAIDYYFMYGPEPDRIVSDIRTITGKAPLYPKWAYGLFMSQYGWKTQEKIQSVIDGYRERKIPLDSRTICGGRTSLIRAAMRIPKPWWSIFIGRMRIPSFPSGRVSTREPMFMMPWMPGAFCSDFRIHA